MSFRTGPDGERMVGRTSRRNGSSNTPVLALIVVLAVVATLLCYRTLECRVESGMRAAVHDQLTEIFPEATFFVGRVTADGPSKLVVNDVRIAAKGIKPRREVLSAERVILHGDLDIAHYVQQELRVETVELFGLKIEAWPSANGNWNLACLKPKPKPDSRPPTIVLNGGTLHIHSAPNLKSSVISIHDISGRIEHQSLRRSPSLPSQSNSVDGNLVGSKLIGSKLVGSKSSWTPDFQSEIRLVGRSSGLLRSIAVRANYLHASQELHAAGAIEDLDFSPNFVAQLPPQLAQYLEQLSGLQCRASSTFEIKAAPQSPASFSLRGRLTNGRLRDPRLPYPLENVSGDFFCKNSLLQLRSMQARSGNTKLQLSTDIHGFGLESPMEVQAQVENLELDQGLYYSLPSSWQAKWDRLQLSGRVSGTVELSFDGHTWKPSAVIACQSVNLRPWLFPYPLTQVGGQVVYHHGRVSSERLEGRAGGQPASASFDLSGSDDGWIGTLKCRTHGPVSINEQLLQALTPSGEEQSGAEQFVRSLQPSSGSVELVNAEFTRSSLAADGWSRTIDAHVYGGTITYTGFKYPLYNIVGRVYGEDDTWKLDRFEGRNDSGRVLCSGSWLNVKEGMVPFELNFQAFDVPAEEELKLALPSDAQYIWDELQPAGAVDSLVARVFRRNPTADVDIRVELNEESDTTEEAGRSLSLLPRSFPYRLTEVDCNITYEPGFVSVVHATAVNGLSRLAMTGECRPTREGRWQANVRWLPTTRLIVDGQLLKALPNSVRDSLVKLDFSGPVSVFGASQVLFGNKQHPTPETHWDCQLDIEDGRLADGEHIGDLRGTVWMEGFSNGTELTATGTLGMDAMTLRGIPVTALQGPFAMHGSNLFFGANVSDAFPRVGEPAASPLVADALSGKLYVSGQGQLDHGKFLLNAELRDAQLTALLQDVGVERASTEAVCNATLQFQGIPWNPQTFRGNGKIQLTDAKLYQLPFMMRLLRTASVNANNDSAFQTAEITFSIDGDHIPLHISCDGDVLRLSGDGWTNLRREVQLELYSYVGRRIPISAVISPLLAESKYATFMMIEVQGTLDNPIMQRRPFPQLEATLEQIFPEVAERQTLGSGMPWRR